MRVWLAAALLAAPVVAAAAPAVSRLTPPSELFANGRAAPIVARFLTGQKFDLQATLIADSGQEIVSVQFLVDGRRVVRGVAEETDRGLRPDLPSHAVVASVRGYFSEIAGVHRLAVEARQSNGETARAFGNFAIIAPKTGLQRVKNIIVLLGDGMGAAHRTAARIVASGYAQGKVVTPLAMDSLPNTAMIMTASLNSIVTDSAPGMSAYVTGNKGNNNQEGVFPDDTVDAFDNPRVEYLSQYLHRRFGTSTGLVTTADVFDATPAANAVYTADRGAGTGIVDQYFDDRELTGLRVLMGGGRKWFLPNASDRIDPQPANGSQRRGATDYVLSAAIASAWHAAGGSLDSGRDLLRDFSQAGYAYAPDAAALQVAAQSAQKLLGLFALSNMNAAADKIAGRRGTSGVTADFGFPNQPMLDEMTRAALGVLAKNPRGFFLLVEGASIDKQSHAMDSDRWILEVIEFDRAVRVAKEFAQKHPDTLVVVTADHECSGAAIIGASLLTNQQLQARAATPGIGAGSAERAGLRAGVVGVYDSAGFPRYTLAGDGYPVRTDVDRKLLIGYAANADRYEDWVANAKPLLDGQQPFAPELARQGYAQSALDRDRVGEFLVTGQVDGGNAAHTGTDIPLSAFGRGSEQFHGVIDNTDVFFMMAAAAAGGRYHKEADP